MRSRQQYVVRAARESDVARICAIYNEGIVDRVATLETELRTPDERKRWLRERDDRHPVVVAEADGALVGWASLNVFNPREAYRHVADFSVYVARDWRGRGVGGTLLERLLELAKALGYHKLVLAGFAWNAPGMALYRRHGFREVGVYQEQGRLDGRWVDIVVMERLL